MLIYTHQSGRFHGRASGKCCSSRRVHLSGHCATAVSVADAGKREFYSGPWLTRIFAWRGGGKENYIYGAKGLGEGLSLRLFLLVILI